ncbi:MAG: O-antigen ligase family protein, partial [Tenericutes bacterium]|nr:O-antigen ligase family protein [Mycoplasmatota bacterium]
YLIRIFVILGVMISIQIMIYYLRVDDIILAIENKSIDLGWGISNFIATYLIMFIVSMTYFVKKYKLHLFWIILFLFEIAMLFFTLSRAGILAFLATSVLLIVFMFVKYDHKWNLLLNLIIGVIIMSAIGYFTKEYFIAIWDRLEVFGLDDSGRIDIWYEAIDVFKANPIFGGGVFARRPGLNELRMFHNTILHVLACFGIIGGIALIVQLISILRIFLYQFSQKKAILLIALIGANIHGLVDNTYLMPQYMVIMLIMIAVVENGNKVDKLRLELRL